MKENRLKHKLIRPLALEQNSIVEMANKIMRKSLITIKLTDYELARSEIYRIVEYYNNKRRYSSLQYFTPVKYYRGNPDVLLAVMETKIEKERILEWERTIKRKKV